MLGGDPLDVTVRDRRKQQELACGNLKPLLPDAALAQQHALPAVKQRVHGSTPLLERQRRCGGCRLVAAHFVAARRARTSGRRSGGTVLGGCRRGCSPPSKRVVVAVTSATAASNASALAADGWVMPLTLRTYWRAAAALAPQRAARGQP